MMCFDKVFYDDTKNGTKIPTNEYLESGEYQIIDQSQNEVGGYKNAKTGLYENVPAFIFGDHTRIIKYVDKPFFIGADGVKILKAIDVENNAKYLYYYLTSKKIENTGYNRHFKWLKETKYDLHSTLEQERIAEELDKVCDVLAKQKKQKKLFDELIKSKFHEMFGDPVKNDKGWDMKSLKDCVDFFSGKAHEQVVDKNGKYILVTSKCISSDFTDFRRTNKQLFPLQIDDIVMVMSDVPNGKAIAKCWLINENNKYTLNQRICCLRNYKHVPLFLLQHLNRNPYFLSFDDGNAQTNLRKEELLSCKLFVPPIELQQAFAGFVNQVEESKVKLKTEIEQTETLYKALMQKYFGGGNEK